MTSADKTPWIGVTGFLASMTLEQWNDIASLTVAALTIIYLIIKISQLLRNKGH